MHKMLYIKAGIYITKTLLVFFRLFQLDCQKLARLSDALPVIGRQVNMFWSNVLGNNTPVRPTF